jgi:two-component system sensor histidine kinase UhpB
MKVVLQKLWYDRSLRTQLLIAVGVVNLCALVAAGVVSIVNARNATRAEIEGSLEMANQFVRVNIQALQPEGQAENLAKRFNQLSSRLQLARVRHVRIYVAHASGQLVQVSPRADTAAALPRAPSWFAALVEPDVLPQELSVVLAHPKGGALVMVEQHRDALPRAWDLGTVVIAGEPADEIAEIWQDVSSIALVWLALVALIVALLYFVLGRILDPLANLARGMLRLEDGQYATRLEMPRAQELGVIAERFNQLAEALGRARAENGRLYGQIITVQEDERREIANELHDEASPCLFGIMANAMSVEKLIERRRDRKSAEVRGHIGEILKVTERLKLMNRVMLKKLRPVALGRVALPALVEDLIGELQRRYPEVSLAHDIRANASSYGEAIDLTVYRCIQEGVTNAIRHGHADAVRVELLEKHRANGRDGAAHSNGHVNGPSHGKHNARANGGRRAHGANGTNGVHGANGSGEAPSPTLQLIIHDDGGGILPDTPLGFGLTVMRERVNALGGSCVIQSAPSHGATLRVVIPIQPASSRRAKHVERIEAH